jgi:hypothetical protein
MSRNKDIKFLHYITGDPYSICRKKLKAAKWSLERVLFPSLEPLDIAMEALSSALANLGNAVSDAIKKIDFKAFGNCEKEEA